MIFHSLDFLLFLALVLGVYWALPMRGQNLFLLGASYFFYGYVHPWYLILIFFTSTVDWCAALGITHATSPERKRLWLALTLTVNFAILCSFKYLDFFTGGHALEILHALGFDFLTSQDVKRLLPVGISFYTFQSASYVIDVYRGQVAPRRRLMDYLLFVSFFPQLVAGPIERAAHLAGQLERPRSFNPTLARAALVLICWGFFKKLVIADNVAPLVSQVFGLKDPPWPVLWAGVFAFGVQIYADFSAYSDIARGVARLLGIDLMVNFRHPYLAASPGEFWHRWHISLSQWFRDYVYIPLGGSRRGEARVCFNVMAAFLLSGLWHGASWNFVIWGAFHGLLLVIWRFWERAPRWLRPSSWWWPIPVAITFVLVHIGWLLFREQDSAMLWHYFSLVPWHASQEDWQAGLYLAARVALFSLPLALHAGWDAFLAALARRQREPDPEGWGWFAGQAAIICVFVLGILVLHSQVPSDFIYFQF